MAAAVSASIVLRSHRRVERQINKGTQTWKRKPKLVQPIPRTSPPSEGSATASSTGAVPGTGRMPGLWIIIIRRKDGQHSWKAYPRVHAAPDSAALVARLDG